MNCCRETTKLGTRLSQMPLAVRDYAERSEREEDGRATGQPQGVGFRT